MTKLRLALAVAVAAPAALLDASSASGATRTFTAVADTSVSQAHPGQNFGSDPDLWVDGDTVRSVLLRFDVSGIAGAAVQSAKLRLHVSNPSRVGGTFHPTSNGWTESGVTWTSAPDAGAEIGRLGAVSNKTWYEVDVTSLVTADGIYNFRVNSTNADGVFYDARERGAAVAPRLIVTHADAAPPPPAAPTNTSAPTIGGTAQEGQVLTASNGTWSGTTPITYAYQWRRCDTAGGACANITGATGQTYALVAGDVGRTIRVVVTATNSAGSGSATSAQTAVVAARAGPPPGDETLPLRAVFYYPWFPEAWNQGPFPYTRYTPSRGYYDSSDPAVIRSHVASMEYGRFDAAIASWWGPGTATDGRIDDLLAATQAAGSSFKWAVYHETEGSGNPTVTQIRAELTHLRDRYSTHPNFLRVGGKFVVFVFADGGDNCTMADRWKQANTVGAYVVLKVFAGYTGCASQPDNWHQYGPAVAADSQPPYSYTISPGFWHAAESSSRLPRDLNRWRQNVQAMVASGAQWQLVTTFNEWGEGTSVESAQEWQSTSGQGAYLDVLNQNGVATPTAPSNTAAPAISGTAQQGQTLTSTNGTWSGTTPITYTRQWRRCDSAGGACANITGATAQTYTLVAGDVGRTIRVAVTATNSAGSGNATSAQTAVVTAAPAGTPPANSSPPAISGTAQQGQTLTASTGTWTGTAPIGYTYQWRRCDTGGGACASIAGATNQTYVLLATDVGSTIRVNVTATNSAGSATASSNQTAVVTAAPTGGAVVLAGAGDIADSGRRSERTALLLDQINPDIVFTLGDNAYESGTASEFNNYYQPYWGRHKAKTRPSAGNHDYRTGGASGYYGYFGAVAGDPSRGYYSYNVGGWHVVVLNTNGEGACSQISCAAGSTQEQWLRADLAANPAQCTLAYWHHPRFNAGNHGDAGATAPLWQALYDANADLVLAGHDHNYQRFAPMTASGAIDTARGIRSFVVGTGGRSFYGVGSRTGLEVKNADTIGVMKLTLRATSYDWQFVPEAGRTFTDSGTGSCH